MNTNTNMKVKEGEEAGFTLLELLIVISIIAILSVALVLVLNPAETLKKSRDAQRISDLNTIKTALGIMLTSSSTPSLDGTFNTATPASSNVCTTLIGGTSSGANAKIRYSAGNGTAVTLGGTLTAGADSVYSPWVTGSGASVSTTAAGSVDGTGWIPTPLNNLIGGSPISNYPVDPTNTVTTGAASVNDLVYRFACQNGGASGKPGYVFEINATLESDAYNISDPKKSTDGGDTTSYYEVGSSLKLLPYLSTNF